jgi:hypothetical protein
MTVRPADAALLGDLVPVLPFITGFAIASIVAGVGLQADLAGAETLAVGTSLVALVVGIFGTALIVVGRDPFAASGAGGSPSDGLGIIGAFTLTYLAVVVALAAARTRSSGISTRAVAS